MDKIDFLIGKLEELQVSADTPLYKAGLFPSQRFHPFLPYKREDDNIFFSACIAFLLLRNSDHLENDQRQRIEKIIDNVRINCRFYSNRHEAFVYNFYQTSPPKHYPNGFILSRFKHFILADDADVTVMVSMALNDLSQTAVQQLRQKLVRFSNGAQKAITGVAPSYARLPFYATWFGSGRMPIELDICVICNVLYFIFAHNLELNEQDKGSLELLKLAIANNDIVTNSFAVSGVYPKTAVILYHITRLCSVMPEPGNYFDTKRLAQIARSALHTPSVLEKILLSTSLLRLGYEAEPVDWNLYQKTLEKDFRSYPFFIAPMLSGTSNKILNRLKKYRLFHLFFRSDAFYYTLILEYELLRKTSVRQKALPGAARSNA